LNDACVFLDQLLQDRTLKRSSFPGLFVFLFVLLFCFRVFALHAAASLTVFAVLRKSLGDGLKVLRKRLVYGLRWPGFGVP
jgi:hypothetical protein